MSDPPAQPPAQQPAQPPPGPTNVAPPPIFYLLVDGTSAVDSAAFGAALEKAFPAFKNLAEESFGKQEDTTADVTSTYVSKLIDASHPLLPIWRFKDVSGKKVAVVMPGGKDGVCTDAAWALPQHRKTLADESAKFMQSLLIHPQTADGSAGAPVVKGSRGFLPATPTPPLATAELVQVSSHGWLGGFMRGNGPDAMRTGDPPTDGWAIEPTYFIVGGAAANGQGFQGPKWIVLAQCSTVNDATWTMWAQVLAKSTPGVRGILAYEFSAPAADPAAALARDFIEKAKTDTILNAWQKANAAAARNWAAIVHKDAVGDKFADWRSFAPLKDLSTTATVSNYLGFITDPAHLAAMPTGQPILMVDAPFGLRMAQQATGGFAEILSSNLDTSNAAFFSATSYRVRVKPPTGKKITSATIAWIHIRASFQPQLTVQQLFTVTSPDPNTTVTVSTAAAPNGATVSATAPAASLAMDFLSTNLQAVKALKAHHSYLWPRCDIVLDDGSKLSHEFRTLGLVFYG